MSKPISLYRHALSGHSHRAELFLSLLDLNYELVDVDLGSGEHKLAPFLEKNAFGQVPVIDDNGTVVADANAILVYLATKYDTERKWLPTNPEKAANVQRFLSVAAGQIAFGPAAARLVTVFGAGLNHEDAKTRANSLLTVLDGILGKQDYLTGEATIADVAGYSYIAHAPEGEVSLDPYPNVRAWLQRIESWAGFVPMQSTAVGLAA